jgi:hypothetical protein
MNKFILLRLVAAVVLSAGVLCCGVKGDPLPPLEPPMIGRGHTNYKGAFSDDKSAAQNLKSEPQTKPGSKHDKENDSDKDEDESDE